MSGQSEAQQQPDPKGSIDTELDTIVKTISGDNNAKFFPKGYTDRIKVLIERETARARYDEAHISLGMNEGSQSAQLDRIAKLRAALTSPPERKDNK